MQDTWLVAVLAPLWNALTYQVPEPLKNKIRPGHRVVVPLGKRKVMGIALEATREILTQGALKPIERICDETPVLNPLQLQWFQWMAQYYVAPLGEVVRNALPKFLTQLKGIEKRPLPQETFEPVEFTPLLSLPLSETQQQVTQQIISELHHFSVHLLWGVTGSGKTEVYLSCLEEVLKKGKQAICLVPEIGLTPQTYARYQKRFGERVALYHSQLSDTERWQVWQDCLTGKISLLIGTRSALFVPFQKLGMIVIDEEQDSSYKQEDRVRYHARDAAIFWAKLQKIPILLGSATPNVETYWKAQTKKFFYHELPERYGNAVLPSIQWVDLKTEASFSKESKEFSLLSKPLLAALTETLARQEQSLIFLNRRGYAHCLICRDCGFILKCRNCEITLTYHAQKRELRCHYCDYHEPPPLHCPECRGLEWKNVGSGTEKIEQELLEHFPDARILRMDRDTTTKKGSFEKILSQLQRREIDILVGTQMIAKGHDYPFITLVGILTADASLHQPNFRAGEETFQMVTQVAGRAGRANLVGQVFLQTFSKAHFSLEYAAQFETKKFYERELEYRAELHYPPFNRLISVRIQGPQLEKVQQTASWLKEFLESRKTGGVQILGPSPCLIERIRNNYRWQILIKGNALEFLKVSLKAEILSKKLGWIPASIKLTVDVDPLQVT